MNMSSRMSGNRFRFTAESTAVGLKVSRALERSTLRHMAVISDAGIPLPQTSAMATPRWVWLTGT